MGDTSTAHFSVSGLAGSLAWLVLISLPPRRLVTTCRQILLGEFLPFTQSPTAAGGIASKPGERFAESVPRIAGNRRHWLA